MMSTNRPGFLVVALCGLVLVACFQKPSDQDEIERSRIRNATALSDYYTAISATYQLWAKDTNELSHLDSLARYYSIVGNHRASLAVADQLLEFRTTEETLKYALHSANAFSKPKKVVEYSKGLLSFSPDSLPLIYNLAKAYYKADQTLESQRQLRKILDYPNSRSIYTVEFIEGKPVRVAFYTVAQNLTGVLFANTGRMRDAKNAFLDAIESDPNFPLPANNLAALEIKQNED